MRKHLPNGNDKMISRRAPAANKKADSRAARSQKKTQLPVRIHVNPIADAAGEGTEALLYCSKAIVARKSPPVKQKRAKKAYKKQM